MGERHLKNYLKVSVPFVSLAFIPGVNSRLDITTLSGRALSICRVRVYSAKTLIPALQHLALISFYGE